MARWHGSLDHIISRSNMALYDFYCSEWSFCKTKVTDMESELEPNPRPICPKCSATMNNCEEHYNGGASVILNGLSTPGKSASVRSDFPQASKNPVVRDWMEKRIVQNRTTGK